jgi:hypothetical protein
VKALLVAAGLAQLVPAMGSLAVYARAAIGVES